LCVYFILHAFLFRVYFYSIAPKLFSEEELKTLGERVAAQIKDNLNRYTFCPVLGYDIDGKEIIINAAEAGTVKNIFERFSGGETLKGIAENLNSRCITTKRRRPFSEAALSKIIRDIRYIGKEKVGEHTVEKGSFPPLICRELFDKCNQLLVR